MGVGIAGNNTTIKIDSMVEDTESVSGSGAQSASIQYTVPSGKCLYLFHFLATAGTSGNGTSTTTLDIDGVTITSASQSANPSNASIASTSFTGPPIVVASGGVITLTGTTNATGAAAVTFLGSLFSNSP